MIRPAAILFDLGDTVLIEHRFDLEAGLRAAVPHLARQVPTLAESFKQVLVTQHSQDREPLLARWLVEQVDDVMDRPVDDIEDAIWPAVVTLEPSPGIGALLEQLRTGGVLLGAVSNAYFSGRVLHQELGRHGLGDMFAFVLSSGDLGSRKPASSIFETALGRAGATASETWFVGDTYEEDIVGAKRAGLTPVWMRSQSASAGTVDGVHIIGGWHELGALWATSVALRLT